MLAQAEAVRPDSRKRVGALLQPFPAAVANADDRHHALLAGVLAEYADQCIGGGGQPGGTVRDCWKVKGALPHASGDKRDIVVGRDAANVLSVLGSSVTRKFTGPHRFIQR